MANNQEAAITSIQSVQDQLTRAHSAKVPSVSNQFNFGQDSKRKVQNNKIQFINSFQKIMFSRASNFRQFMGSAEIRELL